MQINKKKKKKKRNKKYGSETAKDRLRWARGQGGRGLFLATTDERCFSCVE